MTRVPPIIVLTVIGAIAAVSLLRVQFSANLYEMLPRDLPEVQGMDRLNRHFGQGGQLVVTVKGSDAHLADEAVTALAERLEAQPDRVAAVFRELSLDELVTEGGGLLAWLWLNAPPPEFAALAERLEPGRSAGVLADAMESIRGGFFDRSAVVTSYDPLGFSRLGDVLGGDLSDGATAGPAAMTSEDGTFQLLYVEGRGADFGNYREASDWLEDIRRIVSAWEAEWMEERPADQSLEVGLTGTPAFMAEVGTEMERDMTLSALATVLLISLLFWAMHRRSRPLSWLVSAMLAILAITLNLGGLVFGDLSVMSAGFAAILMGLAVDYGIVLYREAMDGGGDARRLRRAVGPSILWAAATTAVVFLSLNLSSLPGLAEMGNLVAMGVVVGAVVMLFGFAPVASRFNRDPAARRGIRMTGRGWTRRAAALGAVLAPLLAVVSMWVGEIPALEANFHPFRIRESPSMKSWQQLQSELRGREHAVPTVITGAGIEELIDHLDVAAERIAAAREEGLLTQAALPTAFVPHPGRQRANAETVRALLESRDRLRGEIDEAGFSDDGAALTETVFEAWTGYLRQLEERAYAMPTGKLGAWSLDRLFARKDGAFAALATVKPADPRDRSWVEAVCGEHVAAASLGSLGTALNQRIRDDLVRVFLPMMALLAAMLALVYRSWRDLALSLFSLLFAGSVLIVLTVWTPLSWNSFNVCGLPLLFGTGLDFSIHMIFALRRNRGDVEAARQGIGKALIFCGASSAIGFGSLATASAHGLASLGVVCATGILVNMVAAVWLLPRWYRWLHRLDRTARVAPPGETDCA